MGETKLVGGFNPSEKYESLGTWDDYSQHMESHNPRMFQPTNQHFFMWILDDSLWPLLLSPMAIHVDCQDLQSQTKMAARIHRKTYGEIKKYIHLPLLLSRIYDNL
jgi:hypothetical protein